MNLMCLLMSNSARDILNDNQSTMAKCTFIVHKSMYEMYECFKCGYFTASSSTFLDSCDFESESICGMIQSRENDDNMTWKRVSRAAGGPDTDYTNMGRCDGKSSRLLKQFKKFNQFFIMEMLHLKKKFLS